MTGLIAVKMDPDRERWLRDYAATNFKKSGVTRTVHAALDLLRVSAEIEEHIRISLKDNWDRYKTAREFIDANVSPEGISSIPFRIGTARHRTDEDFILEETYKGLADWRRRGATPEALQRVLETQYYIPPEAMTEPLFPDESATPAEPAPARPVRKAKATA